MTALLASVRNAAEARLALEGGADLIDLKDPAIGSLGALPLDGIREAARAVAGRAPVSATVGDPPLAPERVESEARERIDAGADLVKVALPAGAEGDSCLRTLAPLAREGLPLVAVLFADSRPDWSLIPKVAGAGLKGIMLDTAEKGAGGLRGALGEEELVSFVREARGLGLLVGLAGSLGLEDVEPLAALAPDYLGFRGALCRGGQRSVALDPVALACVRDRVAAAGPDPAAVRTGATLLP